MGLIRFDDRCKKRIDSLRELTYVTHVINIFYLVDIQSPIGSGGTDAWSQPPGGRAL